MAKRISEAFPVSFKPFGDLDARRYGWLPDTAELEMLHCFGDRVALKDGLEVLSWPPRSADLYVGFADGILIGCGVLSKSAFRLRWRSWWVRVRALGLMAG
ncbi:MAG: hypothetical protein OXI38_08555 [Bacteroidota bacterium]|nr:hypothetical protein [Bacteroidota bacterium]